MNKEQAQNNEIEETIAGIREMAENAFRGKYSDVDEEKLVRAINLINRQNQQIESIQRERDNPQPLTIGELDHYVNKPVWVKFLNPEDDNAWGCENDGFWEILRIEDGEYIVNVTDDTYFTEKSYGKTWLAYATEPEGENHD